MKIAWAWNLRIKISLKLFKCTAYTVRRTHYAHKIYRKKYDCLCFIKIVLLLFVLCFGFFFFVNSLITIYFCAESQPFQVDYLE